MKPITMLGLAVLALSIVGCNGKQKPLPELRADYNAARDMHRRDCPLDGEPPSMKQDPSMKCVAERQNLADLQKQIQEEEQAEAKIN